MLNIHRSKIFVSIETLQHTNREDTGPITQKVTQIQIELFRILFNIASFYRKHQWTFVSSEFCELVLKHESKTLILKRSNMTASPNNWLYMNFNAVDLLALL